MAKTTDADAPLRSHTRAEVLSCWFGDRDIRIRDSSSEGLVPNEGSTNPNIGVTTPNASAITDRGEAALPVDLSQDVLERGRWRLWSAEPANQWVMVMGPWQSSTGEWFQPKGGMLSRKSTANPGGNNPDIDGDNRPIGNHRENFSSAMSVLGKGGIYGLPLDTDGRLPNSQLLAANNTVALTPVAPRWDPYGVMIGPRAMFERGTRLLIPQDHPQFRRFVRGARVYNSGPNLSTAVVGYNHVAAPWIFGGTRNRTGSDFNNASAVQNINAHPDRTLGTDGCDPQRLSAPRRFAWALGNLAAIIGIATTQTTETEMPDSAPGEPSVYYQPRATLFITVDMTGMLTVERSPAFAN